MTPSLISSTRSYRDVKDALAIAPQARFFARKSKSNMSHQCGGGLHDSNSVRPMDAPGQGNKVTLNLSVSTGANDTVFAVRPVGSTGERRCPGIATQAPLRHICTSKRAGGRTPMESSRK